MLEVPARSLAFGFRNGSVATHTSRTMMLAELRLLLGALPDSASHDDYRQAVLSDNVLLKQTTATRRKSFRYLRELYSLEPTVPLFRALRALWHEDAEAQPLLAGLSALARDPLLRATADLVLGIPVGGRVTPQAVARAAAEAFPHQYNEAILAKVGRNAISSWQQMGHLDGRAAKVRAAATCRPVAVAYALMLGFLCDARGDGLFGTLWCRALDAPVHLQREQAIIASRSGWLEYRHAGEVTDISFHHLLPDTELSQ